MKLIRLLFTLIVFVLWSSAARPELHEIREVHYQMGTLLDLTLYHSDPEEGKKILRQAVQEVHRLEGILSNYDPESSLSLLNRQAGQGKSKVPPELFYLLTSAIHFSLKTAGYFDITVGPLMELWAQAAQRGSLPDPHVLAQTVCLVGYRGLKLYKSGEVELARRGMKIDLGGIGKGYAVDRIVAMIQRAGVRAALINFGGSSIYALENPPGEDSWKIGLKGPQENLVGVLHLRNRALSTSGSMGRFWEIGGKRYGHLINPKNGLPVTEPAVATVIAPTATEAEALTKPLILLGKEGLRLMKDFPQTESLSISESGGLELSKASFPITLFGRTKGQ